MASVVDVSGRPRTARAAGDRVALEIYYEHPRWFDRVFAALDRRGTNYRKYLTTDHVFDPGTRDDSARVVFNRMSPSAYHRGQGSALWHTLAWLGHLERSGVRVINGARAFAHELSKSLQLSVIASLGLPGPRTRVIHRPEDALAEAKAVGLVEPRIYGIEGPGWILSDVGDRMSDPGRRAGPLRAAPESAAPGARRRAQRDGPGGCPVIPSVPSAVPAALRRYPSEGAWIGT